MNFRFILAISLALLFLAPASSFSLKEHFKAPFKTSPLAKAYFFGDKSDLSKEQKRWHKDLNLMHLMTPSGLHLSSLLFMVLLFTKKRKYLFGVLVPIGITVFFLPGLASFKRMVLFGLLKTNPFYSIGIWPNFFLTFLISFLGGQYSEGPLSFTLSFIFLGALLCSSHKLGTFLLLFFIQALISQWFENKFYPLGAFYGLILSLTSPLLFPLFLIELIFPTEIISLLWGFILKNLYALRGPALVLPLVVLVPLYYTLPYKRLRRLTLGLTLFFAFNKLNPSYKSHSFINPPPKGFEKIVPLKDGVKLTYDDGLRCYSRLKMDEWSTHCYK